MKRILINCSYSDELRVALVDGAKLFDLDNATLFSTGLDAADILNVWVVLDDAVG